MTPRCSYTSNPGIKKVCRLCYAEMTSNTQSYIFENCLHLYKGRTIEAALLREIAEIAFLTIAFEDWKWAFW